MVLHLSIIELKYIPPVSEYCSHCANNPHLIITSPPAAFLPPTVSAQHIASEGEDPTISCDDPNADPLTGSAQWLDPSGNVASQSRFLTLTNINRTQAGEYVCQLTSSFNQVLSATTNIIVHCKSQTQLA